MRYLSFLPINPISPLRWTNLTRTHLLFIAGLTGAIAFNLTLVLTHPAMLGVDGGAYLLSLHSVQGIPFPNIAFPRPPLAPGWLLWPSVHFWGADVGYKIWSAVVAPLPAIPVYLIARLLLPARNHWPALFAAGFLLIDLTQMELLVTGSLPLIGFTFIGLALYAVLQLVTGPDEWTHSAARWHRIKYGLLLSLSLGIIPFINQTSAGICVVLLPVFTLALLVFERHSHDRWEIIREVLPWAILGAIIGLFALPWYLQVLPGNGMLRYPGPLVMLTTLHDMAWLQMLAAWWLGVWVLRRTSDHRLKAMAVVLILTGSLTIFISMDESLINIFYRCRYFLALPFYLAVAFAVHRVWQPLPFRDDLIAYGAMGLTIALLLVGNVWIFQQQTTYSDMVLPATEKALAIIETTPPVTAWEPGANQPERTSVITNTYSLAHWVAALAIVDTHHTWNNRPPPLWTQRDEYVRCILGWVPGCNLDQAITELNAAYVLIDTRFPEYNRRALPIYGAPQDIASIWETLPQQPKLHLVFAEHTTQLWAIQNQSEENPKKTTHAPLTR